MIEVHKSYKLMQLSLRLGLRGILNSLNIFRERCDTLLINVMTNKSSSVTPNGHLLGLITVPCMVRRSKTVCKSLGFCSGVEYY